MQDMAKQPEPTPPSKTRRYGIRWLDTPIILSGLILLSPILYFSSAVVPTRSPVSANLSSLQDKALEIPVLVCSAIQRDLPVYRFGLGSIRAANTVSVFARVEGELMSVRFKEGDEVNAGDVLAVVDSQRYEIALRQLNANVARDSSRVANAKSELQRTTALAGRGTSSLVSVEQTEARFAQTQADYDSSVALRDKAALDLEQTNIRAPISGRIGLLITDQGTYLRPTDTQALATIAQIRPATLIFNLPESDLIPIRRALQSGAPIAVVAYARDMTTALAHGKLLTIDNQIDPKTGTFRLKAIFENTDNALWPGQLINAKIAIGTITGAIAVPAQALQRNSEGPFVFVVGPNLMVEARQVQVEMAQEGIAAVKGVAKGDRIVVDGQYRLESGAKVTIVTQPTAGVTCQPD